MLQAILAAKWSFDRGRSPGSFLLASCHLYDVRFAASTSIDYREEKTRKVAQERGTPCH